MPEVKTALNNTFLSQVRRLIDFNGGGSCFNRSYVQPKDIHTNQCVTLLVSVRNISSNYTVVIFAILAKLYFSTGPEVKWVQLHVFIFFMMIAGDRLLAEVQTDLGFINLLRSHRGSVVELKKQFISL